MFFAVLLGGSMERQTEGGNQPMLLMAGCLAYFRLLQRYSRYEQ